MQAIDVSNFTGKIDPSVVPNLRDMARRAIVNTQDVDIATEQLTAFGTCFERQLYAQMYFSVAETREIDKATAICKNLNILPKDMMVWLAAEDTIEGLHPHFVDAWIWAHCTYAASQGFAQVGIYTRANWWAQYMANSMNYQAAGIKLWLADADGNAVLAATNPIAGWDHVMKQFA